VLRAVKETSLLDSMGTEMCCMGVSILSFASFVCVTDKEAAENCGSQAPSEGLKRYQFEMFVPNVRLTRYFIELIAENKCDKMNRKVGLRFQKFK
jgi:hypothetical protein